MADSDSTRVLTPAAAPGVLRRGDERYSAVVIVLYRVLVLNVLVAVVKIALGYATGAVSILSDGFHSLTDAASNVVALVGVSIARRPPDANHPYGHRKYETIASLGILLFLITVLVQVLGAAYDRLMTGGSPRRPRGCFRPRDYRRRPGWCRPGSRPSSRPVRSSGRRRTG